ncbi:MAG: hypothetical protein PF630_07840 [Gammaproteobacteria bacterium]|jgi:hypothetical protein|nr:hypothetical protein [Gammaproteobacteria bacterium]
MIFANKRNNNLDAEHYPQRFWLWYSILLIILPFMKIAADFFDAMETNCINSSYALIRSLYGYFMLAILLFVGFLGLENARMHNIARKKVESRYSKKTFLAYLKILFAFALSIAVMIGVDRLNLGDKILAALRGGLISSSIGC